MYSDPSGHSITLAILGILAFLGVVGATTAVTVQAVSDIATGNKFQWENYLSAAIGGFIGGAISFANPFLGAVIGAGIMTSTNMLFTNASGKTNYSGWDIAGRTFLSMVVAGVSYGIFYGLTSNSSYFNNFDELIHMIPRGLTQGLPRAVVNQFYRQLFVLGLSTGLLGSIPDIIINWGLGEFEKFKNYINRQSKMLLGQ